jgi:hypothetical protein
MGAPVLATAAAYYSVLRYRSSVAQGEGRGIGVVLLDVPSGIGSLRMCPLGQVSGSLREQGLLDAAIAHLGNRLQRREFRSPQSLVELSDRLSQSVLLSEPRPTALVGSPSKTLDALYHAFVVSRQAKPIGSSKWQLLDRVIRTCRMQGADIARGSYLEDFLFDAVARRAEEPPLAIQVVSFGSRSIDPEHIEREAGHFLFALDHVSARPLCVLQSPVAASPVGSGQSFERVSRWLQDASVQTIGPDGIGMLAQSLAPDKQLTMSA